MGAKNGLISPLAYVQLVRLAHLLMIMEKRKVILTAVVVHLADSVIRYNRTLALLGVGATTHRALGQQYSRTRWLRCSNSSAHFLMRLWPSSSISDIASVR